MNKIVGFCAIVHFPHPKIRNLKHIHRIVVLPEYQGLGLSHLLMNYMGEIYYKKGFELSITTSLKGFIQSLNKNKNWVLTRYGRVGSGSGSGSVHNKYKENSTSRKRLTASFFYKNNA